MSFIAILPGVLALLPVVFCGLGALAQNTATAGLMMLALVGYAAIVLAFRGGMHWWQALDDSQFQPGRYRRLLVAVAPVILGWLAVFLAGVALGTVALALLIFGHVWVAISAHHAPRAPGQADVPAWFSWGFTGVAVAMLTTVLTMRLLGQTIVF